MIDQAVAKLQAQLNLDEVSKKSMTLKIRSNRNNYMREQNANFWESAEENKSESGVGRQEFDSLKLEMVKEIRDMKNGLTTSFNGMQDSIKDLTSYLRMNLEKAGQSKPADGSSLGDGPSRCPYSGNIISKDLKTQIDQQIEIEKQEEKAAEQKQATAPAVELPPPSELTDDQKLYLQECTQKFLTSFSVESEKQPSINQLKVVFNMIKNPNSKNIADNFKTIQLQNEKFRRIKQANPYFLDFVKDIGFTQTEGGKCPQGSDLKFKFVVGEPAKPITDELPAASGEV